MRSVSASVASKVSLLAVSCCLLFLRAESQAATSSAPSLESAPFGTTLDGKPVTRYVMTSRSGVRVSFMNYGGVITDVSTPDRSGHVAPVTLGFATLRQYETIGAENEYYFGGLLGRFANWLKDGRFTLDGHPYQITLSDPPNTIHGGKRGFDKRLWTVEPLVVTDGSASARLTYVSPDGEEGFPGTVKVTVTYLLTNDGSLSISYLATTDKPTVLNLSSHMSFNLAGAGSPGGILNHELTVDADRFLPLDGQQIPLGATAPVAGTPFDFRQPKTIGSRIHDKHPQLVMADGYDQYWVLNKTKSSAPQLAARVSEPTSGRTLEVLTSEPGVQIYAGGFFGGNTVGVGGRYVKYAAFTMETQHYPDAPNHASFPSTVLRPGETLRSMTIFRFGVRP